MAKLVKMTRFEPIYQGGPATADVHPEEVKGMEAHGWRVVEQKPEPEKPKRGRPKKNG